jgi:DNA-binding NtrC family response regulator
LTAADWEAADSPEMLAEAGDHLTEAAASLWQTVAAGEATLADAVGKFERSLLMMAVNHDHGTRRELAGRLGISERKLYQLLRAYRLDVVERKPVAGFSTFSRAAG